MAPVAVSVFSTKVSGGMTACFVARSSARPATAALGKGGDRHHRRGGEGLDTPHALIADEVHAGVVDPRSRDTGTGADPHLAGLVDHKVADQKHARRRCTPCGAADVARRCGRPRHGGREGGPVTFWLRPSPFLPRPAAGGERARRARSGAWVKVLIPPTIWSVVGIDKTAGLSQG